MGVRFRKKGGAISPSLVQLFQRCLGKERLFALDHLLRQVLEVGRTHHFFHAELKGFRLNRTLACKVLRTDG